MKNKYKVFFEFRGKKMMIETEASDRYDAEFIVKNMLQIHQVRLAAGIEPTEQYNKQYNDDYVDSLKNMFGMK